MSGPIDMHADPNQLLPFRGTLFAEARVVEILAGTYSCEPHDLGLEIGDERLACFRIKRFFKDQFVLAPFNFQPVSSELGGEITRRIISLASASGAKTSALIRLHHPLADEFVEQFRLSNTAEGVETLLALPAGADAAVAALPKKQRWKLKKARADASDAGVRLRQFTDLETLEELYRIMLKAYRDKHRMLPQPISLLKELIGLPSGKRGCHGYVAERSKSGECLGGIFVTRDETQWSYAWAANQPTAEVELLGLGTLLVGAAICDAAAEGVPIFSFGVSPLTHDQLRKFKRNWGAIEHPIYSYYWRERPKPIDLHSDFALAKQVISMMPLAMMRAVSPFAVKWLV